MPGPIIALSLATLAGGIAFGARSYKRARDAQKRDEKTPLTERLEDGEYAAASA